VTPSFTRLLTRPTIGLLLSCLLVLTGLGVNASSPAAAALPSKDTWVHDTYKAMWGSRTYVKNRVAKGGSKLAVNFDIDNTSLASHYDFGKPVAVTLRFAKYARKHGVSLLFNTGRKHGDGRLVHAKKELRAAGYRVKEICGRNEGESLKHSKQRCRQHFVDEGYTLIANVGNRRTDFVGSNYEHKFRLPDYHKQLA
jgi:HAD superfamily, subfamily IIIB (Acid phosphatase)